MLRSGTSLTEQILASHPAVFGAGELPFWQSAYAAYEAAGREGHDGGALIPGMARDYLDHLTALSDDAQRVIDKMPLNFMSVGLICAAFPKARIIHVRRHPIDTCLSIYFQYLSHLHPYANDLGNLAHYYGEYVRVTRRDSGGERNAGGPARVGFVVAGAGKHEAVRALIARDPEDSLAGCPG